MPGTIQVSVLDLMGLPSSSKSVKVSMGNRVHQVLDKGEFTFPLTTLQEDIIVTLYDVEGNELSRTGVNTKLVVEKGIWNDVFPLEGGGHLPMKLQFVLSKEDRQRIQRMRESARKKKQEELLLNGEIHPQIAAVASTTFNHEVTDLRESSAQLDAGTVAWSSVRGYPMASPVSRNHNVESGPEYRKVVRPELLSPNKTDRETEFPQQHKSIRLAAKPTEEHNFLDHTEAAQQVLEKSAIQFPPNGVTPRPTSPVGDLGYSQPTNSTIIAATEATSSAPLPSQNYKDPHLTKSIPHVPVKADTLLPLKEIITRSKSSPTLSTMKQTALWRTIRNNGTENEGVSSEASRRFFARRDVQSPSDNISKQPTIHQIALRKTSKNNETLREGSSSETTHETPAKIDSQTSLANASTKSYSSDNQTERTTEQIALEKTPRNNERDTERTTSVNNLLEEIKSFQNAGAPRQLKEMSDLQLSSKGVSTRAISPKDATGSSAFFLRKKGDLALSPMEDHMHVNENQASVAKTPSSGPLPHANVSKLKPHLRTEVSLKEPSIDYAKTQIKGNEEIAQTKVDFHHVSKPLEMNVEQEAHDLNKVHREVSLKVPSMKEENAEEEHNLVSVTTPLEVNVLQNMQHGSSKTQISYGSQAVRDSDRLPTSQRSRLLKVLNAGTDATEGHTSSKQVDSNTEYIKENMDSKKIMLEEFAETSKVDTPTSSETATTSGRILDAPVTKAHTHSGHYKQKAYAPNIIEKRGGINYVDELETCEISLQKRKSLKYPGAEQSDNQVMGSWILPHEERPLCVTTGSKQMMDLVAHSDTCGRSYQIETILPTGEEREVAMDGNISTSATETKTGSHDLRKPVLERSNDDTFFAGFIGQALKIAIMVAFGTLVIVARPK